jgi:hypothetical protein
MQTSTVLRLGILGVAAIAGVLLFVFRDRLSGDAADLQVGDCVELPTAAGEFSEIQHRPCNEPHNGEIFHLADYPAQEAFPSEAEFEAFFGNTCLGGAFQAYTGMTFEDAAAIEADYFRPVEDGWAAGDHEVICFLFPAGGGEVSQSYRAG